MWSQSIVTPKYLCYKKEELLRQNIFFITQPRDGNHVALSPNLKALVFPAPFLTRIASLQNSNRKQDPLAYHSFSRFTFQGPVLQIAIGCNPIPAPDLDMVYISEECAESVYRLHTKYKYTKM